ncbi:hypothetical protein [Deinococcus apachensis]|uniref:hypothetical protein n=1 Tax=Deinococcus apachensis TaxID=309886 RepID=UPI00036A9E67|nr:hypothetical protein [Deinococcus apachensis]
MNPNADPTKARQAKRAKRKPPGLDALLLKLWKAIETAEELLSKDDDAVRLKAVHALAQTGSAYARAYEVGEMEGRLKAIEDALAAEGSDTGPRLSRGAA